MMGGQLPMVGDCLRSAGVQVQSTHCHCGFGAKGRASDSPRICTSSVPPQDAALCCSPLIVSKGACVLWRAHSRPASICERSECLLRLHEIQCMLCWADSRFKRQLLLLHGNPDLSRQFLPQLLHGVLHAGTFAGPLLLNVSQHSCMRPQVVPQQAEPVVDGGKGRVQTHVAHDDGGCRLLTGGLAEQRYCVGHQRRSPVLQRRCCIMLDSSIHLASMSALAEHQEGGHTWAEACPVSRGLCMMARLRSRASWTWPQAGELKAAGSRPRCRMRHSRLVA